VADQLAIAIRHALLFDRLQSRKTSYFPCFWVTIPRGTPRFITGLVTARVHACHADT
jgi:hypothetical protein